MNWFDKNKFLEKLLVLSWVVFLFFCLWLLSFTSRAANTSNTEIPYIVPNWRNANSCIPDSAIEAAEVRYINDVRNYFGYSGDLFYLCYTTDGIVYNDRYQIFFITNPTITSNIVSDFDFTSGNITVYSNNIQVICVFVRMSDFYVTGDAINLGSQVNLCGSSATTSLNGGNLTPRYPFYMVGTDEIKSANDNVIFTNIAPVVIPTGHATQPDPIEDPFFPTGHARPNQVPQLTINNYTWTTPPTPDFSTLEDTAESIYNYLYWLGSNLIGAIGNIVTNIQNVGNFLAQTLQYYLGLIIDAIKNSINTFYNNMVSLFEPIATAVNYITQPLDENIINDTLNQTSFSSDFSFVKTNFTTFANQFNSISEPSSYKIPIHFENITMFSDVGIQYIDLGWLNSVKSLLRAFLWMVTTYGLIAAIFDAIPNYINGGGDEGD